MPDVNVQTSLSKTAYEALARIARAKKRPLTAVVRTAIEEYIGRHAPVDQDPLLSFIGRGRMRETDLSQGKDWRA